MILGLDRELAETGVEMIAPHRRDRRNRTQDSRPRRRYRRRWKIERLFARLQNFRRLTVRWEHRLDNVLGMFHLACAVVLQRTHEMPSLTTTHHRRVSEGSMSTAGNGAARHRGATRTISGPDTCPGQRRICLSA
jgi:hypothetical protein